jgi:hypothetical protein
MARNMAEGRRYARGASIRARRAARSVDLPAALIIFRLSPRHPQSDRRPSLSLPPADSREIRARGVGDSTARVLLVCAIVAVILWVSGAKPGPFQAGLWLVETLAGAAFGLLAARWLVPPSWYVGPLWRPVLFIAASVTAPMTALIIGLNWGLAHHRLSLEMLRDVLPQVFLISLAMTSLAFLVRRRATETHAAPRGAPPPKFLERLPAKLKGADLFAVEAQDHYLRLHTSLGQDLILMRLGDAIAELEGIEGSQTHRSWWVARAAVVSAERGEGRATLTLTDGAEVPVSRGFAKQLRDAGWF